MLPEVHVGPLTLQTFGICFALGFLGAGALLARRLKEIGKPVDWAYEIIFAGLVGGIVGSRIDYLIQNYDDVSGDLAGSVFSGTGFVWLGGAVGGALGVMAWARWRGFLGAGLFDLCAPSLALGYAIGRVGCQLSGDGDYGEPTDLPWGMAYPEGTVPTTADVHPAPVYETVAVGLIALALWHLRDRVRPGVLFGLYLVLTGIERLLIELIRRNEAVLAGLTTAQLFSLVMVAGGAAILIRARQRPPAPRPA